MVDVEAYRAEARRKWGRATPYRMGLLAGERGLGVALGGKYKGTRAWNAYLQGVEWGRSHREFWPCGHPFTPENTQRIGKAGERCRICRRVIVLRNWRTKQKFRPRKKANV